MRYYPLPDTKFYIEDLNHWNTYQQCRDIFENIKQKWNRFCGNKDGITIYHPEKGKSKRIKDLKKKKKKKKKKGKKKTLLRIKTCVPQEKKIIRTWNDLVGKKINSVKQVHLRWSDWRNSRNCKRFLPSHVKKPQFKVLRGVKPLPLATIPICLADVRAIRAKDKLAKRLAKKLRRAKKLKAKLEKEAEQQKNRRY